MEGHAKSCLEQPDKPRNDTTGEAVCPGPPPLNVVSVVPQLKEWTSQQVTRCKDVAQPFKRAGHAD